MTLADAEQVLKAAFPIDTPRIETSSKGSFKIVRASIAGGLETLGAAFDLRTALQQACKPILEEAKKDFLAKQQEQMEDWKLFQVFIREQFNDSFESWKTTRATSLVETERPAADQAQLVQVIHER